MCHASQNREQSPDTAESTTFQETFRTISGQHTRSLDISSVLYPTSGQSISAQLHFVDLVAACWRLGLVFTLVSAPQFEGIGFVICALCVFTWWRSTVSQFLNGT